MYGMYSRAAFNQERTMMARVRYVLNKEILQFLFLKSVVCNREWVIIAPVKDVAGVSSYQIEDGIIHARIRACAHVRSQLNYFDPRTHYFVN